MTAARASFRRPVAAVIASLRLWDYSAWMEPAIVAATIWKPSSHSGALVSDGQQRLRFHILAIEDIQLRLEQQAMALEGKVSSGALRPGHVSVSWRMSTVLPQLK